MPKPIHLLAVWFVGLIALIGTLLAGAAHIEQPPWICPLLVISAICVIPLFIYFIFLLQTSFRAQLLDDEGYAERHKKKEDMINRRETKRNESTNALASRTASMRDMMQYGINRIYPNQLEALHSFMVELEEETSEIGFVGVSLRGVLSEEGPSSMRELIEKKARYPGLSLRFLLTHPSMASFRERQEGKTRGALAQDIVESVAVLRAIGVSASSIRFYIAPPAASVIFTSRTMLFVPYCNAASPVHSVSFLVDNTNESPLYKQMRVMHFDVPWSSSIAIQFNEKQPEQVTKRVEALLKEYLEDIKEKKSTVADRRAEAVS